MSYADTVLADAPVGYWRLTESAGAVAADAGPHHLNGAIEAGVAFASDSPSDGGHSFLLNRSANSKVTVADNAALDLTGAVSIEAWIKPNLAQTTQQVGAKGDGATAAGSQYGLLISSGALSFHTYQGGTDHALGSYALADGEWAHVVGTRDAGGNTALYVNGAQVASASNPGALNSTANPFTIGGNAAGNANLVGKIAEYAVYDHALSGARVHAHFLAGETTRPSTAYLDAVLGDGPIVLWKLDDTGAMAVDATGGGHAGTYSGTYQQGQAGGLIDGAVATHFNADAKVQSADAVFAPGAGDFSVELVAALDIYGGSAAVQHLIGCLDPGGAGDAFGLRYYGGPKNMAMLTSVGGTLAVAGVNGYDPPAGSWHHLVGTRLGTTLSLYIDGVLAATTAVGAGAVDTFTNLFTIADSASLDTWAAAGKFQMAAYYDQALTADQVAHHYQVMTASIPGAPSGVAATVIDPLRLRVNWTAAPANGSAITGYTVRASDGRTVTVGNVLTAEFDGLVIGQSYTFTVVATNGIGAGPASAPSAPVTIPGGADLGSGFGPTMWEPGAQPSNLEDPDFAAWWLAGQALWWERGPRHTEARRAASEAWNASRDRYS